VVIFSGWGNAAGNYVSIDHQDGFRSIYMHLNSRSVSVGQIVSAGQTIGTTGSTGVSTGDHLHFGISLNGVYVNPCSYVPL
jgi:murein DD-endopeptidase MepM/ murein hydrolase activator NlpD